MERITRSDLDHALEAHVRALDACGITYSGELRLSTGSKLNGIAYRLYRTYVPYKHDGSELWPGTPFMRNGVAVHTGHHNPPVGSDYLGMTAREAYENLCTRNAVLFDVAYARSLSTAETTS